MSAEYTVTLPTPWEEAVQFQARRNEWKPETVMHFAIASGILLLCDMSKKLEGKLARDVPEGTAQQQIEAVLNRVWETIGVSYAAVGERGDLD